MHARQCRKLIEGTGDGGWGGVRDLVAIGGHMCFDHTSDSKGRKGHHCNKLDK
jgi:hypothetical protein